MGLYSLINMILVAIGVIWPGWIGLWAIFLTSFFMSLMYPTIFALGIKGLGPHTKLGGSLIVMAIIGGAVFTPVMGLVLEATASMAKAILFHSHATCLSRLSALPLLEGTLCPELSAEQAAI